MANAFIALCYATAKKAGKDTSKMSPEEVVEWYQKQKEKEKTKDKVKELINEYTGNKVNAASKSSENVENFKKYFIEKIDKYSPEQVKSKVTEYMNRIVKDDKEHCVVIDKDGNVFERTGNETYVEDIGVDLKEAIDIHNHLSDNSFSQDDFNFFKDKIGTEFVNVTPKYIHRVKVLKEIDKPYNYFYRNGLKMDDDWENQDHNVMEFIKSEGYIEYEKSLRNS